MEYSESTTMHAIRYYTLQIHIINNNNDNSMLYCSSIQTTTMYVYTRIQRKNQLRHADSHTLKRKPLYTLWCTKTPKFMDCNLKTNYQLLIIFGVDILDITGHQTITYISTSPNVCFCTTWEKQNRQNITFFVNAVSLCD